MIRCILKSKKISTNIKVYIKYVMSQKKSYPTIMWNRLKNSDSIWCVNIELGILYVCCCIFYKIFCIFPLQALLILDKEILLNNHEIETACLPKYQESTKNLFNKKCFVTSLENVNGR